MVSKASNVATLFRNTRSRTIIIVTAVVILIAIVAGVLSVRMRVRGGEAGKAQLGRAPTDIRSIPGSINPSEQYAKLQKEQNIQKVLEAKRTGGSAIPTIVRTFPVGQKKPQIAEGKIAAPFSVLARRAREGGEVKGIWFDDLRRSNCDSTVLKQALQQGATLPVLREAGCTAKQLMDAGFKLSELAQIGYSADDLRRAGFTVAQLAAAGFTTKQLRAAGFSACDMKNAGFDAKTLKEADYSDGELRGAGFVLAQIRIASGLPTGITGKQIRQAGCSREALSRQRLLGVSAQAIREAADCSPQALLAAGYNASQLRAAGFTAKQLKDTGVSLADLQAAGFQPADLLRAGFTAKQLKDAGFSAQQIKQAVAATALPEGFTIASLQKEGCSAATVRKARMAGISSKRIREILGCSVAVMKAGGYSAGELRTAGFTARQLAEAGYTAAGLKRAGFTAKDLKDAGMDAKDLVAAGYNLAALKTAGFSAKELKQAGLTAKQMKQAGYSVKDLQAAGFQASDLKRAGYSAKQMKDAGFKLSDLQAVGFDAAELKQAGYTGAQLKKADFSAKQLQEAGFSPRDLQNAGFLLSALRKAGFLVRQMKGAGFDIPELKQAGYTTRQLQEGGFTTAALREAGVLPVVEAGDVTDTELQRVLKQQATRLSEQRLQQRIEQRRSAINTVANRLLTSWRKGPVQQVVAGRAPAAQKGREAGTTAAGGGTLSSRAGGKGRAGQAAMIKAGDILFAVLDTELNSDEQGPILATIITGRFKGTKLMGSLQLPPNGERVILNFNIMSIPKAPRTISINAIAIDPNTARTALSSRTDSHILMRWGSLFASSFMEGFGKTISNEGQTIETSGDTTKTQTPPKSDRDNALAALSTVGQKWGQIVSRNFDRPATVHVFSGTSLGILFTQDVQPIS